MKNERRDRAHKDACANPRRSVSLSRALSKLGLASRTQSLPLIQAGRVRINGVAIFDPAFCVDIAADAIDIDGHRVGPGPRVYLVLNKPRGLVTTASDEKGRPTVYECFEGAPFPRVVPVGRLDMASEGLLLFTNDTRWADSLLDPSSGLERVYHVQIDRLPDANLCRKLVKGVVTLEKERLAAKKARVLREGSTNGWLEITLDEGKNREIRRLLQVFGIGVRRLLRVSVGPLALGALAKGAYRKLAPDEVAALTQAACRSGGGRPEK